MSTHPGGSEGFALGMIKNPLRVNKIPLRGALNP